VFVLLLFLSAVNTLDSFKYNTPGVFALLLFLSAVNTLDSFKYNQYFLLFLAWNNTFKLSTVSVASLGLLYFLYSSRNRSHRFSCIYLVKGKVSYLLRL